MSILERPDSDVHRMPALKLIEPFGPLLALTVEDLNPQEASLDTIEPRWDVDLIWLPPLAETRVEFVPIAPATTTEPSLKQPTDINSANQPSIHTLRDVIAGLSLNPTHVSLESAKNEVPLSPELTLENPAIPDASLIEEIQTTTGNEYGAEFIAHSTPNTKQEGQIKTDYSLEELFAWANERDAQDLAKSREKLRLENTPNIKTAGYPVSIDQITKKHRLLFGKAAAAVCQKYEERHPYRKPNFIMKKLAEIAELVPKTARQRTKYSEKAIDRSMKMDEIVEANDAHFIKGTTLTTSSLVIGNERGLAKFTKIDPQSVKLLAQRSSSFITIATNREDSRTLNILLSNDVMNRTPKIIRKIIQHFPRLGTKLLRTNPK